VPAQVVVVEPTGSETQVMLKLGDADIVAVFRERIAAQPGEVIKIAPDLKTVHLFDGESGQRLAA
jgi:multiple sugar transport system ATP-binding protein